MGTVIHDEQGGTEDRHQGWERMERAEVFEPYVDRKAQGLSQRQAAQRLAGPRSTLQAWRAYQERLDECPAVVAFFHSPPGLAFLPRLVLATPLVSPAVGACGIGLVCLFLPRTGLDRFVGASYGTQHQVNRHVEEAIVADRQQESARLAHKMPAKDLTVAQDETCTGGLCVVGIEPVSHDMVLEQAAAAREHDTWHALMKEALSGLPCRVMQATSDEAPGLLAYVERHLGAHHSPDLFPGQYALRNAIAAPMAATQRAAAQGVATAAERLTRVQEPVANANATLERCEAGRPPQGAARLEQVEPDREVARQEHQRRAAPREHVTQSLRAIGRASHLVDVERGVRRNGERLADDIRKQRDTIRTMAQCEGLSQACLERSEKAERVVPKMPATIACVSGYVRRQVSQLDLTPTESYAMHAHRIPSYSLDRVASLRTLTQGEPLRARAERLRHPLCEPGGALGTLSPTAQGRLTAEATTLAEVCQRSRSNVEGRNGYLSLRNHQLRGRDLPRKRAGLTAMHNFFLTRADGTTAAERFFGQKPRSMFATILASVELPPAPLSPPRRAMG